MNLTRILETLFGPRHALARKAFVASAAALSMTGLASAASIGVNFVDTGDSGVQNGVADSLGSSEVAGAGAYAQANWNNLGRWGNPTSLNGSSGSGTSVNATWDSNNTWNTGVGTADPNSKLMHGYLDSTGQPNNNSSPYSGWDNANKPDVWVTGLSSWLSSVGASTFKVVVYMDGDATEGRLSEYWLQNVSGSDFGSLTLGSDLTSHVFVKDTSNFSGTFNQVSLDSNSVDTAGEGNYVVFSGLSGDSFLMRTEEQTFRAEINGFQIVAEVPEPGMFSLVGLGSLGVLLFRRRRH